MPDSKELRQKLKDAKREVRNLSVMGMKPDLSPEKRETVKHLERSARAEVQLRQKALDHQLSLEQKSR
jgi:hypothetical protein